MKHRARSTARQGVFEKCTFAAKTTAYLAARRAERSRIGAFLDSQYERLALKLHSARSPARTVVVYTPGNPFVLQSWEVATVARLWVWSRFGGQLALELYDEKQRHFIFYW